MSGIVNGVGNGLRGQMCRELIILDHNSSEMFVENCKWSQKWIERRKD